jgi:hypothetical protein
MTKAKNPKQAINYKSTDEVIGVIKKLTKNQLHVFGLIDISQDGGHHPKTLEALLNKKLIVSEEVTLNDRFGKFIYTRYYVPLPIHYAWCEWCAENYNPEDEDFSND